jgi:1-acyl-sn-glycerol-3-phosphate acyltransferase
MLAFSLMRSVFNTLMVGATTLVYSFLAYGAGAIDRTGDRVIEVARGWAQMIARLTGMRIKVVHEAPLDPHRPYVFMANHVSAADIWALYCVLPVPVRMIAKKSLGRIPFFGWAMKAGRFIFIDRGNAVLARRSIDAAAARIRSGTSVMLFPEGTRSRDGRLAKFKKGGFHLAANAGVAIVPVAIRGTFDLLPPNSWWVRSGQVEITVGAPIETTGREAGSWEALVPEVRDAIARMLGEGGSGQEEPEKHQPGP